MLVGIRKFLWKVLCTLPSAIWAFWFYGCWQYRLLERECGERCAMAGTWRRCPKRAAWRHVDNSSRQHGTFKSIWCRSSVQEQSEVRLERSAWGQRTAGLPLNVRESAMPIVDMIVLTPEIVKQYKVYWATLVSAIPLLIWSLVFISHYTGFNS